MYHVCLALNLDRALPRRRLLLLFAVTRVLAHRVLRASFVRFVIKVMSLLLATATVSAQDQTPPATTGAEALRVFLDCRRCDFDYLRREITFVNYVLDRPNAQVHVLVTREGTGGGGTAITLDFYGLKEFAGVDDQLIYYTTQNDTDDDERRQLGQALRLGLVRYATQTPLGRELEVSQRPGGQQARQPTNAQPQDDPWNFWVFRTRFNVRLESEEREDTKSLSGSVSANCTTDRWKMRIGVNSSYREDTFDLTDSTFTNVRRDNAVDLRFIRSLGVHMGVGLGGSAVTASFRNQDLTARVALPVTCRLSRSCGSVASKYGAL